MRSATIHVGGNAQQQQTPKLCQRQRIALFHGILRPEQAMELNDEDITSDTLNAHGVKARNIRCAKLDALALKSIGFGSAVELRALEFDALDLVNPAFCSSAVAAFGAGDVTRSFLVSAGDAVSLAGSVAIHHLQLTTETLLRNCAGSPEEAKAVLQQTDPHGGALSGVSPVVLLDTGLRAATLCNLGYHLDNIVRQTSASNEQAQKLGFGR